MKIKYNYLPFEFRNPQKIMSEWKKLIKTTEFTLGYKVKEFEKALQNILVQNIAFQLIMELMH